MKRHILVDIDNTITELSLTTDRMAEMFGKKKLPESKIKDFRLSRNYGLTDSQEKAFWNLKESDIIDESIPSLIRIKSIFDFVNHGDQIFIITARDKKYYNQTVAWLERYNVFDQVYNDVILVGKQSKIHLIESLGIDVVIDDNPNIFHEIENVKQVFTESNISKKNIQTIVVDYEYNKDVVSTHRMNRITGEIIKND